MKQAIMISGSASLIIAIIFFWRREVITEGTVASVDPVFSWIIENKLKVKDKIFGDAKSLYVSDLISRKDNSRGVVG